MSQSELVFKIVTITIVNATDVGIPLNQLQYMYVIFWPICFKDEIMYIKKAAFESLTF